MEDINSQFDQYLGRTGSPTTSSGLPSQDDMTAKFDAFLGKKTPPKGAPNLSRSEEIRQLMNQAPEKPVETNPLAAGANGFKGSLLDSLTQSEQNLGKDIGRGLIGGDKAVSNLTKLYTDNASTLTDLAAKQTDPALRNKYAMMAQNMLADGEQAGLDLKGRTTEQIIGDVLGTLVDVGTAASGLGLAGAAEGAVEAGKTGGFIQGALKGAKTGAIAGGLVGAGQGASQGLQENGGFGDVAGKTLISGGIGAAGGGILGGIAGGGAELLSRTGGQGAQTAEEKALQGAIKDVTPSYNAKKMPAGAKIFGENGEVLGPRVNESSGFGQRTVNSNPMEGTAGKEVANIKDYPTKGTFLQKAQAVDGEISKEAQSLRASIGKETAVMPRENTKLLVENAVGKAAEESLVLQPTDPVVAKYTKLVNKAVDTNPETLEGALNVRQTMDDAYKQARGKMAFGSEKATALDEIHSAARNELNQQMIENAKDINVKASLKKQFDLYRAYDVLNSKAATEGNSVFGRAVKKFPGGRRGLNTALIATGGTLGVSGVAGVAAKATHLIK